ncbi:MAG TPA: TonB-dependent receptor [Parafilimonas sp.]|nr:TonB-dependent receptor [Parafilimonas sp.]
MMKKGNLLFTMFVCLQLSVKAQQDTIPTGLLDTVTVSTKLKTNYYLSNTDGVSLFAGKKTNVLHAVNMDGNLANNVQRTAFSKIPGLNMWEMDGAGTQLNLATRGTDAHRCIEMNMRQNGYNTNSDMFGYPENHYTVPLEAIQEVQYVRGSAALQFGSQFGGMMNFILKQPDSTKPFSLESIQTAGSNNFFNSYNAVGGTSGKISYYAYYDYRHGDGWRDEATFNYHAYYANFQYNFNSKGSLAFQFSRMDYVQQIAGGLDDAQFKENNQQATRSRNYFQPFINVPAITFNYNLSERTHLQVIAHMILGERNSVQFINPPNIADTFNTTIGSYNPRQLDRDYYNGFTTEARILHNYKLGNITSILSGGVRYFTEDTRRKQKGTGTTGSDFDLTLVKPYGIDLQLHTDNYAAFIENSFAVTKNLTVVPGIRYEIINSTMDGVINNTADHVDYSGKRNFPLAGLGLQYQAARSVQFYGNISQAYRPYIYANITPATQLDKIDPDLKDTKGYDIDLGVRGNIKNIFRFDVNPYYVFYGNRVGLLSFTGDDNASHLLTTNIGDAVAKGVEAYTELLVWKNGYTSFLSVFNSLAYNHARYTNAQINKSGVNTSIKGNYVENSPDWIEKAGISFQYKNFSTSFQYSYTSMCYNDALNTESSANGVVGKIPAYHVWDWSFNCNIVKQFSISGGINNLTNEKYFNRRITMYPGPGILPADGRTFYVSAKIKI